MSTGAFVIVMGFAACAALWLSYKMGHESGFCDGWERRSDKR